MRALRANPSVSVLGFAVVALLTLPAGLAHAHALGASFEATSTPYRIDVGYDPINFVVGYSHRFDLELRDESGWPVRFDFVWVRLTKDNRTQFATGIERQALGPTTLLYTFETPGDYTLHVSYRNESDVLAEASFPFVVIPGKETPLISIREIIAVLAGAIIGFGVVFLWWMYRRRMLWTGQ